MSILTNWYNWIFLPSECCFKWISKEGYKHRSIAQWAREAQQLCPPPSASITNREKAKEKDERGEEETSTYRD